jgi:hypothetical protein
MTSDKTEPAIRLAPGDRIASRSTCWRPACREAFGDYRPVVFLAGGRFVVAFCHRRVHDESGHRADVWKYGPAPEATS